MTGVEKALIIPDCHIPFHNRRAFRLMLKAALLLKPFATIILGDFGDNYSLSSHLKKPVRHMQLHDEIGAVQTCLDQVEEAIGDSHKTYICGNHEDRLERYLAHKAPELYETVSIPDLLDLEKRGWKWIPYRDYAMLHDLLITHDIRRSGKYAGLQAFEQTGMSTLIGHIHRIQVFVTSSLTRKTVFQSGSVGWLGDWQAASDYMHKATFKRDWALGFGVAYFFRKKLIKLDAIPIINNRCILEGQLITL